MERDVVREGGKNKIPSQRNRGMFWTQSSQGTLVAVLHISLAADVRDLFRLALQSCVLATILWDVGCLSLLQPIIPVSFAQWFFWAAATIIIQFNFPFFSRFQAEAAEVGVSHTAYVLSGVWDALLTAPLGICCPWPGHICILMHPPCWDVNFRPSVIDGFHTSAEFPPFSPLPADCWYISVVWGSFSQPLFFYGGIIID